jgi:hypothetical protein
MDRAKIVDYYIERSKEKDFTIQKVREELERSSLEDKEIEIIVRLVDNDLQRRMVRGAIADSSQRLIWFGGFLAGAGLFLTVGTYTGYIYLGNMFIIAYGPILSGLTIMFYGIGNHHRNKQR